MNALYDNEDGTTFESPIVCLALVENSNGHRYVELMDMTSDGDVDFTGNDGSNFLGVKIYD